MTSRAWQTVAAALCALFLVHVSASAAMAYSKADRVNVRSRPGFVGEIVTQLKKGQEVTVLDTVSLRRPAADEPPIWIKIALPPNAPAWASAEYIDAATGTVKADMLNVRSGPSYDHGIVARAKWGSTLKILAAEKEGWVQVAAPAGSVGFVPAAWLGTGTEGAALAAAGIERTTGTGRQVQGVAPVGVVPAPGTSVTNAALPVVAMRPATNAAPPTPTVATRPATNAVPPTPVVATRAVTNAVTNAVPPVVATPRITDNAWFEQFVTARGATHAAPTRPAKVVGTGTGAASTNSVGQARGSAPAPATVVTRPVRPLPVVPVPPLAEPASAAVDPSPPVRVAPASVIGEGRWVRREGIVVRPGNVAAPSFYALRTREGRTLMNFLFTTRSGPLSLKEYRGRVVIVTGREYLDRRPLWRHIPLLDIETIEAVR